MTCSPAWTSMVRYRRAIARSHRPLGGRNWMLPHTFGDLGEQPGGQADIHQIHRGIGDYGVQVGGGGEPELIGDLRQLLGGPPKTATGSVWTESRSTR
jgi:hypothetical protein